MGKYDYSLGTMLPVERVLAIEDHHKARQQLLQDVVKTWQSFRIKQAHSMSSDAAAEELGLYPLFTKTDQLIASHKDAIAIAKAALFGLSKANRVFIFGRDQKRLDLEAILEGHQLEIKKLSDFGLKKAREGFALKDNLFPIFLDKLKEKDRLEGTRTKLLLGARMALAMLKSDEPLPRPQALVEQILHVKI